MRALTTIIFLFCLITQAISQEKRISLLFAGDAMQHLPQIKGAMNADGTYNYDSCFYLIKDKIIKADLAGLNFETTLAGKPFTGYPTFSSPDEFAYSLKDAGFNLFFMANNHAVDKGLVGLERTINLLDSINIKHTGTFKSKESRELFYPLMIIKSGIRIAFINYTYATNGLKVPTPSIVNKIDTNQIKLDLLHTKLYKPDIIIAQMHWGEEYHTVPSSNQKTLSNFLLKNGVKIIIGHHPHVVQSIQINKEGNLISSVTYYSLGNFISNQQKINTDGGIFAEIVISKENAHSPVKIESAKHSLFWVEKKTVKNKVNYRLIPEDLINHSGLSEEDKAKMNIFLKSAKKILNHKL